MTRVPIYMLTGFLGSGKTTLLNRMFRARAMSSEERGRFAIIVNEFGDVGIDGDLLPAGATRQVELPGGCICCQLVGELEDALVELLDSQPGLGCILLETTGVADPLPISWTLSGDALRERARLAAVITVVDPLCNEASQLESASAESQIQYADLIVISKLDAVQGGCPAPGLLASLAEINGVAPVIAEPPEATAAALWRFLDDPDPAAELRVRAVAPSGHAHSAHDDGIRALGVEATGTYDLEDLVAALEELPASYIRIKGIVRALDAESGAAVPSLYTVHRVGARVSTEPYTGTAPTRVVVLGKELEATRLADCLHSAVVTSRSS